MQRSGTMIDVVTENFAAGVMERLGFGYERLRELKPDVIYVSNSGFGATGPYRNFKTWGPIVQAISGLTFTSGLPDREPAGWGFSYMDHTGGYCMVIAILMALLHRARSGEGQWVDMSCTETGATLTGPAILDWTLNHRPMRRTPALASPARSGEGRVRELEMQAHHLRRPCSCPHPHPLPR